MTQTLILGGARSGKSALAERLAQAFDEVVYIATAQAGDAEMARRIAEHRARRPAHWRSVEQPTRLAATLVEHARAGRCLLVDCLTLWLSNLLLSGDADALARERAALLAVLPNLPGELLLVSNEVGQGIVPVGELSRRFVDQAGWLHQALATQCQRVILVTAGLPLALKGNL